MSAPASQATMGKGMLCMVTGMFLLSAQDGITKWLTADFHAGEIMFYRGLWMFPALGVLVYLNGGVKTLRLHQPAGVLWRGVVAFATSIFVTLSLMKLPLAESMAVIFSSPLLLTAASPLLLKESVGWQRWAAVLVGFAGVLVMIQPGTAGFNMWVFFPLAAAACSATRDIITRRLGVRDRATTVMFYTAVVTVLGASLTLPFGAHWPTMTQWGLFMLGGTLVTLAHLLIVMAFQLAPGAVVSPLKYLSLVWAATIGFVVWGDVPSPIKLLGAALIVAAGLFLLYRETRIRTAQA